MTFVLGTMSQSKLALVKPPLKVCVEKAIGLSLVDFRVNEGLRTLADQRQAVTNGHSRTMKSKHLIQPDGFVWAVDLVVMIGGLVTWDFAKYAEVAKAMDIAATALGIQYHVRWGCAWDRVLGDFGGDTRAYLREASAYAARHKGSDLIDAPHFEWVA